MIYILEDDDAIRELLAYSLNKTVGEAAAFSRPSELYAAIEACLPELLILDIMLPEEDGISVLTKLRARSETAQLPVIMLTAKDSEFDKVTALDAGADDYVTKPFGVMELTARVRAVMRRSARAPEPAAEREYREGNVCVSVARHEVTVGGEAVALTYKEFELLVMLLENKGKVLTRDRILNEVWDYGFDGENRTVDVHVRSLRQKLGSAADFIETVRGIGYKIKA